MPDLSTGDSLSGYRIVVTGASSGIGRQAAIAAAKAGCSQLLVHGCRNQAGAEETAGLARGYGAQVIVDLCDFADRAASESFVKRTSIIGLGRCMAALCWSRCVDRHRSQMGLCSQAATVVERRCDGRDSRRQIGGRTDARPITIWFDSIQQDHSVHGLCWLGPSYRRDGR